MVVVYLILSPTLTSYVSTIPTLFACFLGFDIPKSCFIFIEYIFIILDNNTCNGMCDSIENQFLLGYLFQQN